MNDKVINLEEFTRNNIPQSIVKVDLLTIAIGPEHSSFALINIQTGKKESRISFNIRMKHYHTISLDISQLIMTIDKAVSNSFVFKVNLVDNDVFFTTECTNEINSKSDGEKTIYEWKKNETSLHLDLVIF